MAYWGKAMALYHQLWDFPGRQTLSEGLEASRKRRRLARRLRGSEGISRAASAFYQDDEKLSHTQRTSAYSESLAQLRSNRLRMWRPARFMRCHW